MTRTKLQVALDFDELPRALAVAEAAVAGGADYIEAGTPLIKSEGLNAVRRLREAIGDRVLIADMKTMDAGDIETSMAVKAGASVVTVCGTASRATIAECVAAGRRHGCQVAVDLMGVEDPLGLAEQAEALGVDWLDVHCAIDAQMTGADPLALLAEIRQATNLTLAVAGGLTGQTAPRAAAAGADVVIVGGAITKAVDPRKATEDIRRALDTGQAAGGEGFRRAAAGADASLRELLARVRTCNLSDGWHRHPALAGLRPLAPGMRAVGPAVTVKTVPGDWAKPVEAIDVAEAGEVIVVDAGGRPPAVWGELATESCLNRGIAGLVCHGAVRDTADIRERGFAVWASEVTSHAGDPDGVGRINVPIAIAGQVIHPGDWIVADDDGVMVLPKARAVEMANRGADKLEWEDRVRAEIREGKTTLAKVLNLSRWEKT